jgi:glycosyltransferase 2 family protein
LKTLKSNWKQGLQVSLSLFVALWIFYVLNKDISWADLILSFDTISYPWLFASILIAVVGYWLRAWRWKLLLNASPQQTTSVNTWAAFYALMFGYLINLLVPRAGEVARCAFLNKSHQLPMGTAIGTVILERIIDLLTFVALVLLGFVLENKMLVNLSRELISMDQLVEKFSNLLPIVVIAVIVLLGLIVLFKKSFKNNSIIKKIMTFWISMKDGLKSVIELKQQFGFWSATVGIWFIYYITLVFMAWAIPATATLSLGSVLVVMVMGSLGMIAPVQGGIGAFHALVAYILTVYGISESAGKIFAIIVHGSQMITLIGLGLVSLVVLFKITSSLKQKTV